MPGMIYFTYHFPQIPPDPLVTDAPVCCYNLPSALTLNDEHIRLKIMPGIENERSDHLVPRLTPVNRTVACERTLRMWDLVLDMIQEHAE